ncbi:MAG: tRNA (N(6)-L-threonylcarbamoyladenosine(37)-C(2))-methylthiotransferase [Bdellovibrionales bacterium]|nr:tRNA (N(6)-L-threonylcarbamoyladenosine(37)-C(2))-methylthiotransferase [Bdellovibrionales bacterium]
MKKVQLITQGCSANQADSEVMAGLLCEAGYAVVDDAPLVVFNTCTVKGPTETSFASQLADLEAQGKTVLITGCIPQSEKRHASLRNHSLLGTYEIDRVVEAIERTEAGELVQILGRKNRSRLNLPKQNRNPAVEIVPLSHGCLSSCTFCKTKHARGELFSYEPNDIVRHISAAVKRGAQEVWLTSQDNSAYGFDIGTNLAELLERIVTIPADFRVRVGMANPEHFASFLPAFLNIMMHPKIFRFVHIPVQAGANQVLRDMKRDYTVEYCVDLFSEIEKALPMVTLGTDLICGFPTETEEGFEETLELMRKVRFDVVNISRYWPRPGTPAASLPQIDGGELKRRTREVTSLFHELAEEKNKRWIGWKGEVILREHGKHHSLLGRNFAYKQVVLPEAGLSLGQSIEAHITHVGRFDLRGELCPESVVATQNTSKIRDISSSQPAF